MKRVFLFFFFIFLFLQGMLGQNIVARVGNKYITKKDVFDYQKLNESDSLSEEDALKGVVDNLILKDYAVKNFIKVSDEELDAYFMEAFNNHPMFTVDSIFNKEKFYSLKNSPKIHRTLEKMREDIIIEKTILIIKEKFKITDEELLDRFINENLYFEIDYYIIDPQDTRIDSLPTEKDLKKFYKKNKEVFPNIKKVKFEYVVVFDDDIKEQFNIKESEIPDSLLKAYIHDIAEEKALEIREDWDKGIPPLIPIFGTRYISDDFDFLKLFNINELKKQTFQNQIFPDPIDIKNGFLVIKLLEHKDFKVNSDDGSYKEIWREYLKSRQIDNSDNPLQIYFDNNLYELIAKIAKIQITEYPLEKLSIPQIAEFQTGKIPDGIDSLGTTSNELVFLSKYNNKSDILDEISIKIAYQNNFSSIISHNKSFYNYKVNAILPSYLPQYNQVRNYLYQTVSLEEGKLIPYDIDEYYKKNQYKFRKPMQVSFVGIFLPYSDFIYDTINQSQIDSFYNNNLDFFSKKDKYDFDYIYFKDPMGKNAHIPYYVKSKLDGGVKIEYLKKIFSDSIDLDNQIFTSNSLPKGIKKHLNNIKTNESSVVMFYNGGWLILYKKSDIGRGIFTQFQSTDYIKELLLHQRATEKVNDTINLLFSEINSYSKISRLRNTKYFFETEFKPITEKFNKLGNIEILEKELVRLYNRWRYPTVIKTDNGMAILFVKNITHSTIPKLKNINNEVRDRIKQDREALLGKNFVSKIVKELSTGNSKVEKILPYFSLIFEDKEFSFNDELPGLTQKESFTVFENLIETDENSFISPVQLATNDFLLLKLKKKKTVKDDDFKQIKDSYLKAQIDLEFKNWLAEYKEKIGVKIY